MAGSAVGIAINQQADIQSVAVGLEKNPLLVVDNFIDNPKVLVEAAAGAAFAETDDYYPGVKSTTPGFYAEQLIECCSELLAEMFTGNRRNAVSIDESNFSISSKSADELLPIQCIPHFDSVAPSQIAMVHYLCGPEHGGTAFYRHRATGFEQINTARSARYRAALERQATTHGLPPKAYINESSELFERVLNVVARFNRAIFYRSSVLHSGDIQPTAYGVTDPSSGRLTITSSIQIAS